MGGGSDSRRLTRLGLAEGARRALPLLPGTVAMAAAIGTLAAQKGLTLLETALMSGLVFAGASQLVALEIWTPRFGWGALATLVLVTATVNLRYFLMTASMRPHLAGLSAWKVYPALLLTVDANWLVAMRYHGEGGRDPGIFLGCGLTLWFFWLVGTVPGHVLGGLVAEPARFGLDFALPAFFAAMLVPLWRGPASAVPWAVAAAAALAASAFVPGWWFIIVGALAGSLAGGFVDDGR